MSEGGSVELHEEVATPNWDTRVRCSCGHDTASRAEMWKHQADTLRGELADLRAAVVEMKPARTSRQP